MIGSFFSNLGQDFFSLRDFYFRESDVLQIPLEFLELRGCSKSGVGEDDMVLKSQRAGGRKWDLVDAYFKMMLTGAAVAAGDIAGEAADGVDEKPVVFKL